MNIDDTAKDYIKNHLLWLKGEQNNLEGLKEDFSHTQTMIRILNQKQNINEKRIEAIKTYLNSGEKSFADWCDPKGITTEQAINI